MAPLLDQAQPQGVEGGDGDVTGGVAEHAGQPLTQRRCRRRGESDRQDGRRWHFALDDEVRNPSGQNSRLATAGPSQDAEGTVASPDNLALVRGEVVEVHTRAEAAAPQARRCR